MHILQSSPAQMWSRIFSCSVSLNCRVSSSSYLGDSGSDWPDVGQHHLLILAINPPGPKYKSHVPPTEQTDFCKVHCINLLWRSWDLLLLLPLLLLLWAPRSWCNLCICNDRPHNHTHQALAAHCRLTDKAVQSHCHNHNYISSPMLSCFTK